MCTVLIDGGAVALGHVSVLKFGSSLLSDAAGFRMAVDEIRADVSLDHRVPSAGVDLTRFVVKPVRDPDAGNPHVRFDERVRESDQGWASEALP